VNPFIFGTQSIQLVQRTLFDNFLRRFKLYDGKKGTEERGKLSIKQRLNTKAAKFLTILVIHLLGYKLYFSHQNLGMLMRNSL
jgi:hypothetical protein